jgi:hypothetical protein
MHPVKLLERAASTAVHAMRHPISSAAYTTGVARGLVGAALRVVPGGHDAPARPESTADTGPRPVPTQRAATQQTTTAPPEPERVPKPVPEIDELPEPIVIEAEDEEPGESFATEPKAVSRESAHGGADADDADIDGWSNEATARGGDVDVETPVGTTGAGAGHNPSTAEDDLQQTLTQPLMDPATAKALRSETETLRKASDPDGSL